MTVKELRALLPAEDDGMEVLAVLAPAGELHWISGVRRDIEPDTGEPVVTIECARIDD